MISKGLIGKQMKSYLVRGTLFVVPAVITVSVVVIALRFLSDLLTPVASVIETTTGVGSPLSNVLVLLSIVIVVLLLGVVIETIPHGVAAAGLFHSAVESIPGVGSVYASFREMSTTIADGEESFRDVKLVEYPTEGSYAMAFVTADAPPSLEESAGHADEGMVSLFLPMGPNPIMGGFVIYVSRDRVHDIDIGVDEGLQAIITSGVAMSEPDQTTAADRIQPTDGQ